MPRTLRDACAPLPAPPHPPSLPASAPQSTLCDVQSVRKAIGNGTPATAMRCLLAQGLGQLPLPGSGRTLERWRVLAAVGAADLALAKLFEGHTDALAILAELSPDYALSAHALWGVWAAEGPGCELSLHREAGQLGSLRAGEPGRLRGAKAWCSGAADVSHALVTARTPGGQRQLVAVCMKAPGVRVDGARWQAVGMAASASADVYFDDVTAHAVGEPGAYLRRPGFWHGGAGVAACWFGAARELGQALLQAPESASPEAKALRAVALGRTSLALTHSAALLRSTAVAIDDKPAADVGDLVRLLRLSVDQTARTVLEEVMRALGPAPFCRDNALARLAADLPVFIRQCHGDGDFLQAGLAARQTGSAQAAWPL